MDTVRAVQARISEIQAQVQALTGARVAPVRTPPAPSSAPASFATSLEAATALSPGAATGALTPADRRAPGGYGSITPPAELVQYGNGRIPAEALASIGDSDNRLYRPAAEAFVRMRADAQAAGATMSVNDSYRSYDEQVQLAAEKGLYSQGGLAATPGSSNHGWGLAVDLELDDNAQRWMRENAWRYGFVEDVAREPWHWTFRPSGTS